MLVFILSPAHLVFISLSTCLYDVESTCGPEYRTSLLKIWGISSPAEEMVYNHDYESSNREREVFIACDTAVLKGLESMWLGVYLQN